MSLPFRTMRMVWSLDQNGPASFEAELTAEQAESYVPGTHVVINGPRDWGGYVTRLERSGPPGEGEQVGFRASGLGNAHRLDYRIVRHDMVVNDRADVIIEALLAEAQDNQSDGDMGFAMGTISGTPVSRLRTYCPGVVIGDAIRELASIGRGFDWEVDAERRINVWNIARGTDTELHLYETDTHDWQVSLDTSELLTNVTAIADPSEPWGPKYRMARTRDQDVYGRHDSSIDTDIVGNAHKNPDFIDELKDAAAAVLAVQGGGRLTMRTVWLSDNAPWEFGDVWLGDTVHAHLPDYFGGNHKVRCTDITVTVEAMPPRGTDAPIYWVEMGWDALIEDIDIVTDEDDPDFVEEPTTFPPIGSEDPPYVPPTANTDDNSDLGTVDVTLDPSMSDADIQDAIDTAGDGATIEWATDGTHYTINTDLRFHTGQKHFSNDGAIIALTNTSNIDNMLDLRTPKGGGPSADNVTLSDLEFWGHVSADSTMPGSGAPRSIIIPYIGTFFRRGAIKGAKECAVRGQGDRLELGCIFDTVEIAYNVQSSFVTGGTESAFKLTQDGECGSPVGSSVKVINCHVHHNAAHGVWFDIGSAGVLIANNLIEHNARAGVHWEVGAGPVLIRDNTIRYSGGAGDIGPNGGPRHGIYVVSAATGQVVDNDVSNSGSGYGIYFNQDRNPTSRSSLHCPQLAQAGQNQGYMFVDWTVEGNTLGGGDRVNNTVTDNAAIHYTPG